MGEVANNFNYGLNAAATDFDGIHKYIRITDIDDESHKLVANNLTSPDVDYLSSDSYIVRKGDILFARTGASVGKTYMYEEKDGLLYFAGFLIKASIRSNYDYKFIFQNTLTSKYDKFIKVTSQRSGQPGVNAQEYQEFEIMCPRIEEQVLIGDFFHTLDNTIALHKGQLDKLKLLKKSCLQQMFPQNGEKVPRIRFADFHGEWGQRKLGEVATFAKGKGYSKNNLIEYGYKIILYGKLYTNYETVIETIDTYVESDENAIRSHVGDVIVPASGETAEDIARASVIPHNGIILGGDLNIIETNKDVLDPNFLALSLSYGIAHKELSKYAQGKSVVHLHGADLKRTTISFPNLDEQKQIGNFFKQLDITITLYHKKLNELTAIKKVCLEKFFI